MAQKGVKTPWGDSEGLRERRLQPGPGTPPAEVAANQRERLFGAMVASVYERGYSATTLSDLVEISGVSRRTVYTLFGDKEACFAASVEAMLGEAPRWIAEHAVGEGWEERLGALLGDLAALAETQPAAARMCLLDSQVAGGEARAALERASVALEAEVGRLLALSGPRAGLPEGLIVALVGAMAEIARELLVGGREDEIGEAIAAVGGLLVSYRTPPGALRLAGRPSKLAPESIEGPDHRERALRALAALAAENGYQEVSIAEVTERASMSSNTFYANFKSKEDALGAAIESAGARLVAAAVPAFRRHESWPEGVRAAVGTMLSFLASRPALAQLLVVEAYSGGPAALERRNEALRPLEILLAPRPGEAPLECWAIAAGALALAHRQIREHGAASLPALAPHCTYLALAPFIGPEEACAAANGSGAGRVTERAGLAAIRKHASQPTRRKAMALLERLPGQRRGDRRADRRPPRPGRPPGRVRPARRGDRGAGRGGRGAALPLGDRLL